MKCPFHDFAVTRHLLCVYVCIYVYELLERKEDLTSFISVVLNILRASKERLQQSIFLYKFSLLLCGINQLMTHNQFKMEAFQFYFNMTLKLLNDLLVTKGKDS